VTTGIIPSEFVAWQRFAGIMFACFSVGAYLVVAGLGALSLASAAVSRTLAWVFVAWGLSAGFIVGYNVPSSPTCRPSCLACPSCTEAREPLAVADSRSSTATCILARKEPT
jgi:hypothetical protein